MPPSAVDRYSELAIFAGYSEIPIDAVELLWSATGGLSRQQAEKMCLALADMSLISDLNLGSGVFRLHDVLCAFLAKRLGESRVRELHGILLEAASRLLGLDSDHERGISANSPRPWWQIQETHGVLTDHIPQHLNAAGFYDELAALLTDLRWAEKRIAERGVVAIGGDLAVLRNPVNNALAHAIQQNAHLLSDVEPPTSLGAIMVSRFEEMAPLRDCVAKFRPYQSRPLLSNHQPLPDLDPALLRTMFGHTRGVSSIAIAADGSWLVSVDYSGVVRIWNPSNAELLGILNTGTDWQTEAVQIAPDGSWMATTEYVDPHTINVRIWDSTTRSLNYSFESLHQSRFSAKPVLSIAPDSSWLAVLAYNPDGEALEIRVLDAHSGESRITIIDRDGWPAILRVSPDGRILAAGDEPVDRNNPRTQVRLWDPSTGELLCVLDGHTGPITSMEFAPDGSWICTCDYDGVLRIWSPSGELLKAIPGTGRAPHVAVAPDGSWLTTSSDFGTGAVEIWDVANGARLHTIYGDTPSSMWVSICPDGTWLATIEGNYDWDDAPSTLKIWDARTYKLRQTMHGTIGCFDSLTIAPDGTWLATSDGVTSSFGKDRLIRIWSVREASARNLDEGTVSVGAAFGDAIDFTQDGDWVAASTLGGGVRILDSSLRERKRLSTDVSTVKDLALSPRGDWLSVCDGEIVQLWDVETGRIRTVLSNRLGAIGECVIAPNGTWLLTKHCFQRDYSSDFIYVEDYPAQVWDTSKRIPPILVAWSQHGRRRGGDCSRRHLAGNNRFWQREGQGHRCETLGCFHW